MHRVSKKVGRQLLVLHLILVDRNLKQAWKSRSTFEWMGRKLKVVSRDGLAKMKRSAGRKQDLADLEHLGIPASARRKKT
jgi:hypothetical protein